MDADTFARWLHAEAVAKLGAAVFAMMESADRADLGDSEWGRMLPLWERLEVEDKQAVAAAVERAAYDSLSRLMVALDDGDAPDGVQLVANGAPLTGLWAALAEARDAAADQ